MLATNEAASEMSDGQVEITVRHPVTRKPAPDAGIRAEDGDVIFYGLPPGEAFRLDPTKDVIDFQHALDRVAGEALKQRQRRRSS